MKFTALLFVLLLAACEEQESCKNVENKEKRHEYFIECLKLTVPGSPNQVHYNDQEELVSECGRQALIMSTDYVCEKGKKP